MSFPFVALLLHPLLILIRNSFTYVFYRNAALAHYRSHVIIHHVVFISGYFISECVGVLVQNLRYSIRSHALIFAIIFTVRAVAIITAVLSPRKALTI